MLLGVRFEILTLDQNISKLNFLRKRKKNGRKEVVSNQEMNLLILGMWTMVQILMHNSLWKTPTEIAFLNYQKMKINLTIDSSLTKRKFEC